MRKLIPAAVIVAVLAGLAGLQPALAQKRGSAQAQSIIIDTGDTAGAFNVTVGTSTAVLLSSAAADANIVWRTRTFQVTNTPYSVWVTTYPSSTWNTGAGFIILGSTGSYFTRSQAAFYGILDPTAAAGTAKVRGPYEYQAGDIPSNR